LLEEAMNAFDEEDYLEARDKFEALLELDPDDMGSRLSLAQIQMLAELYPDAAKELKIIIDDGDNLFIQPAEYYLGLCYLKTGQNEVAREHFKKIAKSDSFYSKDARKIKRGIK
jgi:tetratricopeptide (TPR) repeat protein